MSRCFIYGANRCWDFCFSPGSSLFVLLSFMLHYYYYFVFLFCFFVFCGGSYIYPSGFPLLCTFPHIHFGSFSNLLQGICCLTLYLHYDYFSLYWVNNSFFFFQFFSDIGPKRRLYLHNSNTTVIPNTYGLAIFMIQLFLTFLKISLGVGIDGGNSKDWEVNARSIQLIKQRGKVKALDEEIHSKLRLLLV